jgi:hypothetical protein
MFQSIITVNVNIYLILEENHNREDVQLGKLH